MKVVKNDDYELLSTWLDKALEQELPKSIIAFNFNLYEGSEGTYDIQLIGSDEFDEDDGDWACTDYCTTREDICYIKRTEDIDGWEEGLNYITKLVEQYLNEGKNAHILKSSNAVGIGFVDGDIEIIYRAY
jgi:hypothetical protein